MVARFVEQHGVRAHEENAGKRDAHLPAARQRSDVAVHHHLGEIQSGQHFPRPPLERIAAQCLEPVLRLAIALDDRIHGVGLIGIGHRGLKFSEFRGDDAHRARAIHDLEDHAAARHLANVLAEIADGDAAIDGHLSLVRRILAGDHAEERGLAGAVRADEADFLAPRERRRRFDEQQMLAVLLGYAF